MLKAHGITLAPAALVVACLFLTGCNDTRAIPPEIPTDGPWCEHDGFCTVHDEDPFYIGAFRRGEQELRFRIAYHKNNLSGYFRDVPNYCGQLMSGDQHVLSADGGCRDEWQTVHNPEFDPVEFHPTAVEFYRFIKKTPAPSGHQDQWTWLTRNLQSIADNPPIIKWTKEQEEQSKKINAQYGALHLEKSSCAVSQVAPGSPPKTGASTQSAEAVSGVQNLEENGWATEAKDLLAEDLAGMDPSQLELLISGSGDHGSENIFHAKRVTNPDLEFRQEVEIWAQPAKLFLNFGPRIGSEHSATLIRLFQRRILSDDPWIEIGQIKNFNHGAGPNEGNMALKRVCGTEMLPITHGYYIWGGSCDGDYFFDHLCNDDTAYQLRSAFGIWTTTDAEGKGACRGRRRYNPPSCSIPW